MCVLLPFGPPPHLVDRQRLSWFPGCARFIDSRLMSTVFPDSLSRCGRGGAG